MSARSSQVRARADRQRPHLRVVRKNRRGLVKRGRSARLAPPTLVGILVAIALVFGILLEQIVLAQSAFRLSEVRDRLAAAEERYEELMHEAVLLDNPARIERIATKQLGMVEPDPAAQKFVVARLRRGDRLARAARGRPVLPTHAGAAAAGSPERESP